MHIARFIFVPILSLVVCTILSAVNDTIPPVITVPASYLTVECNGSYQDSLVFWFGDFGGLEASDNNDEVFLQSTMSLEETQSAFDDSFEGLCISIAEVTVGFFATDDCGNSSIDTSFATFRVADTEPPTITVLPIDITLNCDELLVDNLEAWLDTHGDAEAEDVCSDEITWNEYLWTDNQGNNGFGIIGEPTTIIIERESCNWFANVSFFAADACGNRAATIGRVTVNDTTPPYFETIPLDITVSCDQIPAIDAYPVLDYCEANLVYIPEEFTTQVEDPSSCDHYNYLLERVYNASDACGNTLNYTQLITVIDTLPPDVSYDLVMDAACTAPLDIDTQFISVADPCGSEIIIAFEDVDVSQDDCSVQLDRTYTISDVCGNDTIFTQRINLIDNLPPDISTGASDLIIPCDTIVAFNTILEDWIANLGGSVAADSCSQIFSFVAESGSFDLLDPMTYPGDAPNIPLDYCQVSEDGIVFTEQYTVVYYDACGNASQTAASVIITDEQAPEFIECQSLVEVPLVGMDCIANATIPIPIVEDNCQSISRVFTSELSAPIESNDSGSTTTLVNPIAFSFSDLNINQLGMEDAEIRLDFIGFDGDGFQEFFNIIIEGNDYGQSPRLQQECQDTFMVIQEIPADSLRSWLSDGVIDILLEPNMPPGNGSLGINDICDESFAMVTLSTQLSVSDLIQVSYSLDSGDNILTSERDSIDLELEEGIHSVEFFFRDCGGNIGSCITQVEVIDNQPPNLTCPNDTTIVTENTSCCVEYQLSTDFTYADNCISSGRISQTLPEGPGDIEFNFNPISESFSAINRQYTFTIPNATSKILENPQIRIDVIANTFNDFVTIIDETGEIFLQLDASLVDPCSEQESLLRDINLSQFESWIQDDTIRFTFVGAGLPPCGEVEDGFDGLSSLRLTLLYSDIQPDYTIEGDTLISGMIEDLENAPVHELCVGTYAISYQVQDATGNIGSCSYSLTVTDLIDPEVTCRDTSITLPLDGILPYVFEEMDLIQTVSDNCGEVSTSFDINEIDCDDVNSTVTITTTATDESGNTATCMSNVQVIQQQVVPTFSIGICQDEDLQLFSNVPGANNFEALQFFWTGPNDYLSNQINPIIENPQPSDAGIYTLVIQGLNGCGTTASIDVQIDQFSDPTINVQNDNQCVGDDIVLTTDTYSGDVTYSWYEGAAPNGILIAQTDIPTLTISSTEGLHLYYVEVSNELCVSIPSPSIGVDVSVVPSAAVLNPFITVCEGDPIQLNAIVSPISGVTYRWSGPNGYQGDGISPITIPAATLQSEGSYTLIVENNGCLSDIATVQVVVFDSPDTPVITGDNLLCEGVPFSLTVSNVTNADAYTWYKDDILFSNTNTNTLTVNSSTVDLSGEWTCTIESNLCTSEESLPFIVNVATSLQVGVSNDGPVCVGDSVTLISTLLPQATYTWLSPSGVVINGQSPRVIAEAGEYSLTVINSSGCESTESTSVLINTPPIITALSNSAPLCEMDEILIDFSPTIFPPGNYQYIWSGPNNFSSDQLNPQIINATSDDNGEYTLIAIGNGCQSEPVSTFVDIGTTPSQPQIIQVNNTCQGEVLQLIATNINTPGVEYIWETPSGTQVTSSNILLLANEGTENTGNYSVTINSEGCTTIASVETMVEIFEEPEVPQVLIPELVCEGDDVILSIIQPDDEVTYSWSGPNGTTNVGTDWILADVTQVSVGTYTVIASQNDCQSDISNNITFFVRSRPDIPELTFLDTIVCRGDLEGFEYCFDLDNFFDYDSIQLVDMLQDSIILTAMQPCTMIDLSYLNGEGFFSLTGFNQGCTSELSQTFVVNVEEDGVSGARFMFDSITICDSFYEGIMLDGTLGLDSIVVSASTSTIDVELLDQTVINISSVEVDQFELYVTTVLGRCGIVDIDTLVISREEQLIVGDQIVQLPDIGAYTIDLLENAEVDQSFEISILNLPEHLTSSLDGTIMNVISDVTFIGNDNITYMVCSEMCPMICDTANVLLQVGNPDDCLVSNVVTPNNDGFNDTFRIPCLTDDRYNSNSVSIFNRWGDEVYSAAPYLNDWNAIYEGSELPSGTYFYILELNNDREPIQGFIVVER